MKIVSCLGIRERFDIFSEHLFRGGRVSEVSFQLKCTGSHHFPHFTNNVSHFSDLILFGRFLSLRKSKSDNGHLGKCFWRALLPKPHLGRSHWEKSSWATTPFWQVSLGDHSFFSVPSWRSRLLTKSVMGDHASFTVPVLGGHISVIRVHWVLFSAMKGLKKIHTGGGYYILPSLKEFGPPNSIQIISELENAIPYFILKLVFNLTYCNLIILHLLFSILLMLQILTYA